MEEKLSKLMLKISEAIIKLKLPIVILVTLITVFFAFEASKLQIDSNIINSLPDDDPSAKLYKDIGDKYQGNDAAMIILETDNVFQTKVLEDIRDITDSIQTIRGITSVMSLTNIIDIKSSEWGLEIGKLVDEYELPQTPQQLDSLRNRVFEKDMYRGVIVSEDSTSTVIIANLANDADRDSVVEAIKNYIKIINPSEKVYYTGIPFMMRDVSDIIVNDLVTLLPITALIIIVILFFGFKSLRGVVMPLLTVLIAIIWTIGLMTMLGYKLTVISDVIPIILLALGSAYTIHVLNRINETEGKDRTKALIKALAYIIVPVFLAYITTAFGFLSFVFGAYLTMIRDFGIFTAIGITIAFLLSVTFTPAFISLVAMYKKDKAATSKPQNSAIVTRFLKPLAQRVMQHPKRIVALWTVIALIFASGTFLIDRKVDMISYFKKDSQTYKSQKLVDDKLGGASPVYLVFKGDVQSPEFLQAMKDAENFMKQNSKYVSYTMSVADLVEQMNDAMGEGMKIPDSREKIEQLWFMLEGEDIMSQLVNYELTEAVVQARFATLDSKESRIFDEMMKKYVAEHSTENIQIQLTGMPNIYNKIDKSLINSQLSSLAIAIFLMLFIVSLTLWSFKDGLLSIIPLILTILISFGFMGITHIPLDIATVLVASVTLGVGIDYAVHIVSHYRNYFQSTQNVHKALEQTIAVSGNAIFINVLAVSGGFLVFIFSNLVPLNNFGIMMALSMVVSGFAAITLLPALIILWNKKKEVSY